MDRISLFVAGSCVLNIVALVCVVQIKRELNLYRRWQSLQADRLHVLRRRLAEPPYSLEYVQSGHIEAHLPPSSAAPLIENRKG